jgi:phage terminase Nu1 subunit (DNA packaging protein)
LLSQQDIAEHLDMSQQAVSALLEQLGIDHKAADLSEIRVAYIRRLREAAAGRGGEGAVGELAAERARLAREQADKIAMQNAVTRGELAPVALIEEVLTKAASKVAAVLDSIVPNVRRRVPELPADKLDLIGGEVAKARNTVAAMSLADLNDSEPAKDLTPEIIIEEAL